MIKAFVILKEYKGEYFFFSHNPGYHWTQRLDRAGFYWTITEAKAAIKSMKNFPALSTGVKQFYYQQVRYDSKTGELHWREGAKKIPYSPRV